MRVGNMLTSGEFLVAYELYRTVGRCLRWGTRTVAPAWAAALSRVVLPSIDRRVSLRHPAASIILAGIQKRDRHHLQYIHSRENVISDRLYLVRYMPVVIAGVPSSVPH